MHMQKDAVIHDTSSISSLYDTLIAYTVDASSACGYRGGYYQPLLMVFVIFFLAFHCHLILVVVVVIVKHDSCYIEQ